MSPRPSRDMYSPLISSPLNPDGHADIKTPWPTSKRRRSNYGDLSPTQRLLVHKVEEMWNSHRFPEDNWSTADHSTPVTQEKPRFAIDGGSVRPSHKAHWEEGVEDQDFFSEDHDDCDEFETRRGLLNWSADAFESRARSLFDSTSRALLLAGFMCLGGCLPMWAFLTAGDVHGVWPLHQWSS
ncbi:hypothetical protein F5X68DRAFT_261249 [Plectosphaerella plurivora]|uniref:Uncharacterized protein n=1 Tax=Plectosphaerella plurivora TaxID=936078 RepID=A0A9P9AAV5_9PEZI|nr:hypothetical protein F5X68DRAFT_261249 [Plectosphaerella plurivora]